MFLEGVATVSALGCTSSRAARLVRRAPTNRAVARARARAEGRTGSIRRHGDRARRCAGEKVIVVAFAQRSGLDELLAQLLSYVSPAPRARAARRPEARARGGTTRGRSCVLPSPGVSTTPFALVGQQPPGCLERRRPAHRAVRRSALAAPRKALREVDVPASHSGRTIDANSLHARETAPWTTSITSEVSSRRVSMASSSRPEAMVSLRRADEDSGAPSTPASRSSKRPSRTQPRARGRRRR